jgi:hypothetical protein
LPDRQRKYEAVPRDARLYQGEIVSGLIQAYQRLDTIGTNDQPVLQERMHPFAVVVTQDCDLEGDYRVRSEKSGKPSPLSNVLFCEAVEISQLKEQSPGKDVWKRVVQNKNERYQCLEDVPKEQDTLAQGIPALGTDFKRYFTISIDEVYKRLQLHGDSRRCRLITPYAEHFLSRFFYFQSRFALPEDHDVPM